MMIEKFNICIDQEQIDQLHTKLNLTRWPDEINDEFWSHGTGMHFLKDLSAEWLNTFNWRDHEEKLNIIVLSSNQTLIWDSLNAIGYKNKVEGFGKLFNS